MGGDAAVALAKPLFGDEWKQEVADVHVVERPDDRLLAAARPGPYRSDSRALG